MNEGEDMSKEMVNSAFVYVNTTISVTKYCWQKNFPKLNGFPYLGRLEPGSEGFVLGEGPLPIAFEVDGIHQHHHRG